MNYSSGETRNLPTASCMPDCMLFLKIVVMRFVSCIPFCEGAFLCLNSKLARHCSNSINRVHLHPPSNSRFSYESLPISISAFPDSFSLLYLFGNLGNPPAVALAARKPPVASAHMTFQQFLKETAHVKRAKMPVPAKLPVTPIHLMHSTSYSKLPPSAEPPTMQPLQATLSAAFLHNSPGTPPLDLLSSDHRLEVPAAPGSLDFSQASVSGSSPTKHPSPSPTPTRPAVTPTASAPSTHPAVDTTPVHVTLTPPVTSALTHGATATPSPISTVAPSAPSGVSGPYTLVCA